MAVEVNIDARFIERALRRPGGIGERLLRRRAAPVVRGAEQLAPGRMAQGITLRVEGTGRGMQAIITSTHPASLYVINGTAPTSSGRGGRGPCDSRPTGARSTRPGSTTQGTPRTTSWRGLCGKHCESGRLIEVWRDLLDLVVEIEAAHDEVLGSRLGHWSSRLRLKPKQSQSFE